MSVSPAILIRSRLQRPGLATACLRRTAALERLDAILDHRLTRVTAPAGFGKSQLVSAWVARVEDGQAGHGVEAAGVKAQVRWLRLDPLDCAPASLCAYLEAALASGDAGTARARGTVPLPAPNIGAQQLAPELATIHRRLEKACALAPLVLVIDDVDAVREPLALAVLDSLLRDAPDDFHLVMLGRRPVPLAIGAWQARRQVFEVGPALLRIAAAEHAEFARLTLGAPCPEATLAVCAAWTHGWPLALQLMLRQLRPPFDVGGIEARRPAIRAALAQFVEGEVLHELPAPLQEFLLLASVTSAISHGLAERIAGGPGGVDWLDELAVRGLLADVHGDGVPASTTADALAIEPLLCEILRDRLQRERPGHALLLHRTAAQWFAEHGDWRAAIVQALQGGDAGLAAQLIEQGADVLLGQAQFACVLEWIGRLPAETRLARPRLLTVQAWALTFLHRREAAQQVLDQLEATLRDARRDALAIRAVSHALADDSERALADGEAVLALSPAPGSLADDAAHTAVVFGLAAASRFDDVDALHRRQAVGSGLATLSALYRRNLFAFSAFQAGRLDRAGLILEEVLAEARAGGAADAQPAAVAAAYLAAIYYERNDPEAARALLQGRRHAVERSVSLSAQLNYLRTEARLADLAGDGQRAFGALDAGLALGRSRGQLRLQVGCLAESVRLHLAHGNVLEADRELRRLLALGIRAPDDRASMAATTWDSVRLAEARMLLAFKAPRRAVPLLRALCDDLRRARSDWLAASASLVLVRALDAAGEPEAALEPLWQVLIYGQQNGLVRTFADEGASLAGPLSRLLLADRGDPEVDPEYMHRLRRLLDPRGIPSTSGSEPAAGVAAGAARLSARETEILQYMARGLSNKQIARALGLSPETVKWYLKNIYEKLQVSGRVQAIQAGLGIRISAAAEQDE